jgi:hypothetical protein
VVEACAGEARNLKGVNARSRCGFRRQRWGDRRFRNEDDEEIQKLT